MVPTSTTNPELSAQEIGPEPGERELLTRLLGLYATQNRLYQEVLQLSRRQTDLVRAGSPLTEIRAILVAKRARLETISHLETTEADSRRQWRHGRHRWTASARARMQRALTDVGRSIEEILASEEENDRELVHYCR